MPMPMRGLKETGPPPLGRGMMTALQPRMQALGGNGLRGSAMAKGGRLGGRDGNSGNNNNNNGGSSNVGRSSRPAVATSQDEKFQLQQFEVDAVRPFAMAIRLTPELLSDLKRAEGEGEACLMKFGFTATGHVLKIGDEEFKFNSAREDGGLCDIFEEQRRGEDGNGILKEAGSVWRKLSVLRTLNASEKDRVKKRSVEAQQQQKSRKAIILDPTHSQNLNQNSSIAGDVVGRRPPVKTKVQPPRKKLKPNSLVRSPIPAPIPAPVPAPKPTVSTASVIASAKAAKAAAVASLELLPSGKVASLPPANLNGKPPANLNAEEGATPVSVSSVLMDGTPSPTTTTPDTVAPAKLGVVVGPTDLRNCLITLLTENPKGMKLKAVEKCLGDSMPLVKLEKKTIEKAIRAIASYHAPGKYVLKEGVTFAKPSPNSGSECGSNGDKLSTPNSSMTVKSSSIVQKSNENAVSRAIRKVSESYLKGQPHSQPDHLRPTPDSNAQNVEGKLKKVDVVVDAKQISVGVDESGGIESNKGGGRLDMNSHSENLNGGVESAPTSSKERANSGGSESSSSSGSSDSDSESSESGDSRSGTSGSRSDSDRSSSDSDDENMDEDVEIVSDGEGGDPPHQKQRANDKKKVSHLSKEAKLAKVKPPEKLSSRESEEIDIGGENGAVHSVADLVMENRDVDDMEVDVVSVGGGDSPQITGTLSPVVSEHPTEDRRREVGNARAVEDHHRESLPKSGAPGNSSAPSIEELAETGESGIHRNTLARNRTELGKLKAGGLKASAHNVANNRVIAKKNSPKVRSMNRAEGSPFSETNMTPLSRDSLAQSSSPSRVETGTQSLDSPTFKTGATAMENTASRKGFSEVRKSTAMDVKTDAKLAGELNKHIDASQSLSADATPGSRDGEGSGFPGRETEAEVLPSSSRPLGDERWRQNADGPGLLEKPANFGRSQGRETELGVSTGKSLKHGRNAKNELDSARRHESVNEPDSWGKSSRDLDGAKLENDGDVNLNRVRKDLTGLPGRLSSREHEKEIGERQDRESGEWRDSTSGIEQFENKGRFRKSQNRVLRRPSPGKGAGDLSKRVSPGRSGADIRKPSPGVAAAELRKPSPGDLRSRSPAKVVAGDTSKPSPVTSHAPKPAQYAQKELQRFDQVGGAAKESNRAVSGVSKLLPCSQAEDRSEGGSARNGNRSSNDSFERPGDSRALKRKLDEERSRVYKKSSMVSVDSPPLNSGATKSAERKQVSPNFNKLPNGEVERAAAGSLEGPPHLAGPSAKGNGGGNDRKQRLLGKATPNSSAKQPMEPQRGRDWKPKTSAGLLGPEVPQKKENLQLESRLSDGKRPKSSSSPEEVSGKAYFAKYEKDTPDLRGPIRSPEEAEAYKKEYQIKYSVYTRLYADLERNGGNFQSFKREMSLATSHPDKLQQINARVRREFHAIRKEFKRMQKTFDILHDELQTIKQHLRSFAGGKAGQG